MKADGEKELITVAKLQTQHFATLEFNIAESGVIGLRHAEVAIRKRTIGKVDM